MSVSDCASQHRAHRLQTCDHHATHRCRARYSHHPYECPELFSLAHLLTCSLAHLLTCSPAHRLTSNANDAVARARKTAYPVMSVRLVTSGPDESAGSRFMRR